MSILDSRDLEEELNNPDTDKERKKTIKELKKENDDLKTLIKNSSSFQNLRSSL